MVDRRFTNTAQCPRSSEIRVHVRDSYISTHIHVSKKGFAICLGVRDNAECGFRALIYVIEVAAGVAVWNGSKGWVHRGTYI